MSTACGRIAMDRRVFDVDEVQHLFGLMPHHASAEHAACVPDNCRVHGGVELLRRAKRLETPSAETRAIACPVAQNSRSMDSTRDGWANRAAVPAPAQGPS